MSDQHDNLPVPTKDETSDRLCRSSLKERIVSMIEANGPMSVADYMGLCLSDKADGYYATRDPFGVSGDFVTAPEISQMFGELIGVWIRSLLEDAIGEGGNLADADLIHLIEFGPGRGTLMADMLRAIGHSDGLRRPIQVHLVETSPHLKTVQQKTLRSCGYDVFWHTQFGFVPEGPCYVVGNEFFDAIPFRQFVYDRAGWAERVVGLDSSGDLTFGLLPGSGLPSGSGILPGQMSPEEHGLNLPPAQAGDVLEISPQRQAIAAAIGMRISAFGGAGLFVDYGHARSGYGDTFQAVKKHEKVSVLSQPGQADLTSHVDFAALQETFSRNGLFCPALKTQSEFLLEMGLLQRAGLLGQNADAATREMIRDAVERLAGPDQMGHLFKTLCVVEGDKAPFPFA